ncbi:MAG TPA: hypothetical protein VF210_20835 [Pseudomonadales bacterium]
MISHDTLRRGPHRDGTWPESIDEAPGDEIRRWISNTRHFDSGDAANSIRAMFAISIQARLAI